MTGHVSQRAGFLAEKWLEMGRVSRTTRKKTQALRELAQRGSKSSFCSLLALGLWETSLPLWASVSSSVDEGEMILSGLLRRIMIYVKIGPY